MLNNSGDFRQMLKTKLLSSLASVPKMLSNDMARSRWAPGLFRSSDFAARLLPVQERDIIFCVRCKENVLFPYI